MNDDHRDVIGPNRRDRLPDQSVSIRLFQGPPVDVARPMIAITSSRLGRDLTLHRHVGRLLSRVFLFARRNNGQVVVAHRSAIEPWAARAARLFDVPITILEITSSDPSSRKNGARDATLIAAADRVEAVYVRPGGTIHQCLVDRIETRRDASTRVAVATDGRCAAAELIARGAVGRYLAGQAATASGKRTASNRWVADSAHDDWTGKPDHWLVHCTRGSNGPWPGETPDQYRDSILLDQQGVAARGPIDALGRIVRTRRLVASAVTSSPVHPVVCFSAVPLVDLLPRRCFRPHLGRWDYEPFGVAIRRDVADDLGIQPVIYGTAAERSQLAPASRFRFHPIGKTYDWRTEQEWRCLGSIDLDKLDRDCVRIFAAQGPGVSEKLASCPWAITWLRPVVDQSVRNAKPSC